MNVFVGINYICCDPFFTETDYQNDTVIITINDTCSEIYQTCYRRCECYYTWDFQFTDFEQKEYYFIISLNVPIEDDTIFIFQGGIDLTE